MPSYHLYLALCSDNTLYTGITTDLKNRLKKHNSGKGAAYTRGRLPIKFVYTEKLKNRSEATKRELEIKKLSRKEKEKLKNNLN
jgi:putative endonuclease